MLSVIKTAIVTILISFISGVLLDRYKNVAPKILCNMKKSSSEKAKNKGFETYLYTVKNVSKKTIHNLNINLQSKYNDLKIRDTKITNGLKFEVLNEDDNYNVSIPFLSKDDVFSVRLFLGNNFEGKNKPIVVLRSPEDFKRINSKGDALNIVENVKAIFQDKRVIAIATVIFFLFGGISFYNYLSEKPKNANDKSKTVTSEESLENSSSSTSKDKSSSSSNEKAKSQEKTDNSSKKESNVDNSKSKSSSDSSKNSTKLSTDKGDAKGSSNEESKKIDSSSNKQNGTEEVSKESKNNENNTEKKEAASQKSNQETKENSLGSNKPSNK